jgi:hypothetical protein
MKAPSKYFLTTFLILLLSAVAATQVYGGCERYTTQTITCADQGSMSASCVGSLDYVITDNGSGYQGVQFWSIG